MSTNLEKLQQAGIVGVPHAIGPEDEDSINTLSDSEVDALISVKSKLSTPAPGAAATASIGPVGTISF